MMMKGITIAIAAAAAMLISADIASAQGMGRGPVASACAPEIEDIARMNGMVRAGRALAWSRTGAGFPMIAGRCCGERGRSALEVATRIRTIWW